MILRVTVIAISRMTSVGWLMVTTPLVLGLVGTLPRLYVLYGVLAWRVIVYSHRPNIRRPIEGAERRLGKPRA